MRPVRAARYTAGPDRILGQWARRRNTVEQAATRGKHTGTWRNVAKRSGTQRNVFSQANLLHNHLYGRLLRVFGLAERLHLAFPTVSGPTPYFLFVGAGLACAAGPSQPTCQRPRLPEASSPIMLTRNLTKIKALEENLPFSRWPKMIVVGGVIHKLDCWISPATLVRRLVVILAGRKAQMFA